MLFTIFDFRKFDLKSLNIFFIKNQFCSIGFFLLYKILICSGISVKLMLNFIYIPFVISRCVNYCLYLFNNLKIVKSRKKIFLNQISVRRNLRSFLFRNYLPCNGQRTKTNAKTSKKRRRKFLKVIKN